MLIPHVTAADYELPYTKDGELYGDVYIDQLFRPYKNQMYGRITEHLEKFRESTNPVGIYQYYKNNDGCTLVTWSVDLSFPPTFYILKDKDSETRGFLLYTIDNRVMFRAVEEHTEFATTVRINDESFVLPPSDRWYTRTTLKAEGSTEQGKKDCFVNFKVVDRGIGGNFAFLDKDPFIDLDVWENRRDLVTFWHNIRSNGLLIPREWTWVTRSYRNESIPTVILYNCGDYSPTEVIGGENGRRGFLIDNYYSASGELVCRTSGFFRKTEVSEAAEVVLDVFDDFVSIFRGVEKKTELSSSKDYIQLGLQKMPTPGIIVVDGNNETRVSRDAFTRYTNCGSFTNTPKPKQLFLFDRKMEPIKVTMANGAKEIVDFSPVKKLVTTSS